MNKVQLNAYANEALVGPNVKIQVKVWTFVLYIWYTKIDVNIPVSKSVIYRRIEWYLCRLSCLNNMFNLNAAPPSDSLTVIINNIEQQQPLIEIVQVKKVTTDLNNVIDR